MFFSREHENSSHTKSEKNTAYGPPQKQSLKVSVSNDVNQFVHLFVHSKTHEITAKK